MDDPNILEVNSAIETLIAGAADKLESAMSVVIAYGQTLPITTEWTLSSNIQRNKKSDRSVSGLTEHGQVTIKDSKETNLEWSNVQKARVGHYKIWRPGKGHLEFHHFWKSNMSTSTSIMEEPDRYHLVYDPKSLTPTHFGIERLIVIWAVGPFVLSKRYLELKYGTGKMYLGFAFQGKHG